MDLNYLYHRQQVSQFRADEAACRESRHAHQLLADSYGVLIEQIKSRAAQFGISATWPEVIPAQ